MNYLLCERCRYETRVLAEACLKCGTRYVCEWDPAWYRSRFTRASMGQSSRARKLGSVYASCAVAFTVYGFPVHAVGAASRDAWANYFIFTVFLLFCSYEVWAFTRGRTTMIDRYSHEAVPKKTELRVLGLVLDVAVSLWAAYHVVAHDA